MEISTNNIVCMYVGPLRAKLILVRAEFGPR